MATHGGGAIMNQGLAYEIAAVMPAATLTGLFSSLCTIQQPDGALIGAGQPSGTFTNVAGLVNIPCVDAPPSIARVQATEVKAIAEIMSIGLRHILLNGYYANIIGGNLSATGLGWRAIVDGITYDILGAEADSQLTQTRLDLRLATV